MEQLRLIFDLVGTPTDETWEGYRDLKLLRTGEVTIDVQRLSRLRDKYASKMTAPALGLLERLVELDPDKRLTAARALDNRYFLSDPRAPSDPSDLGRIELGDGGDDGESSNFHEFQTKKRRREAKAVAQKKSDDARRRGLDEKEVFDAAYREYMAEAAKRGVEISKARSVPEAGRAWGDSQLQQQKQQPQPPKSETVIEKRGRVRGAEHAKDGRRLGDRSDDERRSERRRSRESDRGGRDRDCDREKERDRDWDQEKRHRAKDRDKDQEGRKEKDKVRKRTRDENRDLEREDAVVKEKGPTEKGGSVEEKSRRDGKPRTDEPEADPEERKVVPPTAGVDDSPAAREGPSAEIAACAAAQVQPKDATGEKGLAQSSEGWIRGGSRDRSESDFRMGGGGSRSSRSRSVERVPRPPGSSPPPPPVGTPGGTVSSQMDWEKEVEDQLARERVGPAVVGKDRPQRPVDEDRWASGSRHSSGVAAAEEQDFPLRRDCEDRRSSEPPHVSGGRSGGGGAASDRAGRWGGRPSGERWGPEARDGSDGRRRDGDRWGGWRRDGDTRKPEITGGNDGYDRMRDGDRDLRGRDQGRGGGRDGGRDYRGGGPGRGCDGSGRGTGRFGRGLGGRSGGWTAKGWDRFGAGGSSGDDGGVLPSRDWSRSTTNRASSPPAGAGAAPPPHTGRSIPRAQWSGGVAAAPPPDSPPHRPHGPPPASSHGTPPPPRGDPQWRDSNRDGRGPGVGRDGGGRPRTGYSWDRGAGGAGRGGNPAHRGGNGYGPPGGSGGIDTEWDRQQHSVERHNHEREQHSWSRRL